MTNSLARVLPLRRPSDSKPDSGQDADGAKHPWVGKIAVFYFIDGTSVQGKILFVRMFSEGDGLIDTDHGVVRWMPAGWAKRKQALFEAARFYWASEDEPMTEQTMCPICRMWGLMPYAKRHTTPTSVAETEGALIVGYWMAIRNLVKGGEICDRHLRSIHVLDENERQRAEQEIVRQHELNEEIRHLRSRQALVAQATAPVPPPLPPVYTPVGINPDGDPHIVEPQSLPAAIHFQQAPEPPPPPPPQPPVYTVSVNPDGVPFAIGPGPLPNGIDNTPQPALPVMSDMAAPYRTGSAVVGPVTTTPSDPALINAPCLFCGVDVKAGEIHNCSKAAGTSGLNPIATPAPAPVPAPTPAAATPVPEAGQ